MDTYKNVMKNHILYSFAYGLGHKGIMLGKAWLNNRSNWYDVAYGWHTGLCQNCRWVDFQYTHPHPHPLPGFMSGLLLFIILKTGWECSLASRLETSQILTIPLSVVTTWKNKSFIFFFTLHSIIFFWEISTSNDSQLGILTADKNV